MEVSKTLEGPEGLVTFQGSLSQEETDFVLSVGLNQLLMRGALPFTTETENRLAIGGPAESAS